MRGVKTLKRVKLVWGTSNLEGVKIGAKRFDFGNSPIPKERASGETFGIPSGCWGVLGRASLGRGLKGGPPPKRAPNLKGGENFSYKRLKKIPPFLNPPPGGRGAHFFKNWGGGIGGGTFFKKRRFITLLGVFF